MTSTTNTDCHLFWCKVAHDLKIQIQSPYEVCISDEITFSAEALVKDFGGRNGMIVVHTYETVQPHVGQLSERGFGYSTNIGGRPETYDREQMIEVLSDWGWSGEQSQKPVWLE